jgi:hypothetical protein
MTPRLPLMACIKLIWQRASAACRAGFFRASFGELLGDFVSDGSSCLDGGDSARR